MLSRQVTEFLEKKIWAAIQLLVLATGLALTESSMDTVTLPGLEANGVGRRTKISLGPPSINVQQLT